MQRREKRGRVMVALAVLGVVACQPSSLTTLAVATPAGEAFAGTSRAEYAPNDSTEAATTPASGMAASTDDALFSYIETIYGLMDRKLADYLEVELSAFLRLFPASEHVPAVRYLQGRVVLDAGDDHRAFALFMKTLFLHPKSTAHAQAAEGARMVVTTNKYYQDHRNELLTKINGEFLTGEPGDLHYEYISFLQSWDHDKFQQWCVAQYQEFFSLYPSDPRNEKVLHWIAETYTALDQHREAAASYLKFEYLFPASNLVPAVRIRRAEILSEKLRDPELAVAALTTVITDHPQTSVAGTALFMRAQIKTDKLKDFISAGNDYQQLADSMPQHARSVDALLAKADLHEKKLKQYAEAVDVYDEIVKRYPQDLKSVTALEEAGGILLHKLHQPISAASRYARIADILPNSEKAPESLLKAARVCLDKARNADLAAEHYQRLVDEYPRTDQAREARQKLAELQKKPSD